MSNPMMTNTLWYKDMCVKITVYEQSTNNYEKAKWELDDYTIFVWVRHETKDVKSPWLHDGRDFLKLSWGHHEGKEWKRDNAAIYDEVGDWLDGLTEEQLIDGAEEVEEEPPPGEDMRSAAADQKFHEMRDDGLI